MTISSVNGWAGTDGMVSEAFRQLVVCRSETLAVERHALQRERFAIEHQRPAGGDFGIWPQPELGGDAGGVRIERHVELDLLDQKIGRRVVFQKFGLAGGLMHGLKTIPSPSLLEAAR